MIVNQKLKSYDEEVKNLNIAAPIESNDVEVIPHQLQTSSLNVNSLSFIPHQTKVRAKFRAIFTHGYTSHKSSIISWASRLSENGIPVTIFDLPGHYLGSYNDISSFEVFKNETPGLYKLAYQFQNQHLTQACEHLLLGGHSLGALMTLKASSLFNDIEDKKLFLVGFGLNEKVKTHFFATSFFRKTLNVRKQLVSDHLNPDQVFNWIKEEKLKLSIKNQEICLISGEDDVVIGPQGMENLEKLLSQDNKVKVIKPKKLPHNQPELASTHIFNYLKDTYQWSRT